MIPTPGWVEGHERRAGGVAGRPRDRIIAELREEPVPSRRLVAVFLPLALVLLPAAPAFAQQNLGHKLLGTIGLEAGMQAEPGVYIGERGVFYTADRLVDHHGTVLPVGLDLNAFSNAFGVMGVFRLPWLATYVSTSVAVPLSHVSINTERPEVRIDQFGLADVYVQPLRLGWRVPHFDVGLSYGFYAPTGRFEPGGRHGVGRGQWSHEFSLATAAYLDEARTWHCSALTSYELNSRKQGIDITRGPTVQIQGGAGKTLDGILDVGLAAYAEWQVGDDRGADLPAVLHGARDRAYGLGPEVGLRIPRIGARLTARYERDLAVRSRPEGQILLVGVTFVAWRPGAGEAARE